MAEISLSQPRGEGAELVAGPVDERLIRYVDDEEQLCLTSMGRGDFGFQTSAPEERNATRLGRPSLGRLEP